MNRLRSLAQRHWLAPLAVFALGLVLTWLAMRLVEQQNERIAASRFATLAQSTARRVEERLRIYGYELDGARGAVLSGGYDQFSRRQFRQYSEPRDIDDAFVGARGIGMIRRVTEANERSFLEAARRDGKPDFAIKKLAPHDGDLYVIQYIEPMAQNLAAIGLDVASEPNRRWAAETSMRSGKATITQPITLLQSPNASRRSFLLLLPVYAPDSALTTATQRAEATVGWTYVALVMDEVLADIDFGDQLWLSLQDSTATDASVFFSKGDARKTANGLSERIALPIYGRSWRAEMHASPMFFERLDLVPARSVFAVGSTLSSLLAILVYVLAQDLRRKAQVRSEQARLAAVVGSSSDAIIAGTLEGIVTDWNRGAELMFGWTAQEVIGRPLATRLLPPGRADEDIQIRDLLTRGTKLPPFDSTRVQASGALVDVSVSAAPTLDFDGRITGFSMTIRDISLARRAARQALELNAELERQVTERTQLLETARRSLQTTLDAVPFAIAYVDKSLILRFANTACCEWFGRGELVGVPVKDVLGERFEATRAQVAAALRGQPQSFDVTMPLPGREGQRHTLRHYLPDVAEDGVRGFHVVAYDLTEQVEARLRLGAALRENEALLRAIHQHAIVSVADRTDRILEVNGNFCKLSGYTRAELVGQRHAMLSSKTHGPEFWTEVWRTIGSGQPWRGEICNRAKDGSLYWVDSMIAPFVDERGKIEKYISIRFDITTAKLSEISLAGERLLLTSLLDNVPDRIHFKDREGRFLRVNPSLAQHYQLDDPMDAIGKTEAELLAGDRAEWLDVVERAMLTSGKPVLDIESNDHWRARAATWSLTTLMPLRDADGEIIGTFGVSRDITARKRMEAELKRANERMAMATDGAGIGIWEFDVLGNAMHWDDWMYRLYGQSPANQHPPYELWPHCLHPVDRARAEREFSGALGGTQEFDTEFRILRGDGEVRHLKASAKVVRDPSGRALRMIGVNFDITERKRAEGELRATSSLLRSVLESASEVSIIAADPDLNITIFNAGAERLLGYRGDEIVNKQTPALLHDPEEVRLRAQELSKLTGQTVEGGQAFIHPLALRLPREWTYVRKDDTRVSVSLVVTEMRAENGEILGYVGIAHDVTRQKQYEETLRDARQRAEQANLAKSQFLANMSHEIRTPLNAVIGLSYLMEQTSLDSEQSSFLSKIRTAGKSLLSLINDTLDISKIEAGELMTERARFDLRELIGEVRDLMSAQAEAKQIANEVDVPESLPSHYVGDATRVSQVLVNLVSNAIKFTERGSVKLSVREIATDGEEAILRFEVRDTGIGISEAAQARLFVPFAQADTSTTRRFGGTGLGLSIVKRLAELMGGSVDLRSIPGEGSTFAVTLRLGRADSVVDSALAEQVESIRGRLMGVRVLVADDSDINLSVAERILRQHGARVSCVNNGADAVRRLEEHPAGFDLVLMDVQMPVMDGQSATREIRGRLGLTALPIIALTADARASERERCLAAGMVDFLTKPFDPHVLVQTVQRHVAPTAPRPSAARSVTRRATASGADWPEIDGVNADAAYDRLGGDDQLFRSLLLRLTADFGDLASAQDPAAPLDLKHFAARAHKLRGSAAQLGADEIQSAAEKVEEACREESSQRLPSLLNLLGTRLQRLRVSAERSATAFELTRNPERHAAAVGRGLPLREFVSMLREQTPLVTAQLPHVALRLHAALGPDAFEQVQGYIRQLRFSEALGVLERVAGDQPWVGERGVAAANG